MRENTECFYTIVNQLEILKNDSDLEELVGILKNSLTDDRIDMCNEMIFDEF
jgi:hypothetical protein